MSALKSICIIDDDKIYTYGVTKIIKNYLPDNNITSYENGQKALEAIKNFDSNEQIPDLILLDIDMPEMNGWDFLREFECIRDSIEKEIKVFVISSQLKSQNEELYKIEWNDKVSGFIKKPVGIEEIEKLLK